jgi:hypothetical protein
MVALQRANRSRQIAPDTCLDDRRDDRRDDQIQVKESPHIAMTIRSGRNPVDASARFETKSAAITGGYCREWQGAAPMSLRHGLTFVHFWHS